MKNITELVKARRSVRTFDKRKVSDDDIQKLFDFMTEAKDPYDIPVKFKLLDAKRRDLKCPVVSGTSLFVGIKVQRVPHAEEAVGYWFEQLVLYAQSIGIGTVWIGGTMDRAGFEKAVELEDNEIMPIISPLGYTAEKMSVREVMMRKGIKADSREAFEALFFDGSFDTPLTEEKAGKLAPLLENVRLAPSAVNKQPWRIIVDGNNVHFYLKHGKNFVSEKVGDMQKIDMGIALCHFALSAEEAGIAVKFCTDDPGIETDMEYIASYKIV